MITVSVDGTNLNTAHGFTLFERPPVLGAPPREWLTEMASLVPGGVLTANRPDIKPRALTFSGIISGTSAADKVAKRNAIVGRLRQGEVQISFSDLSGKVYFGYFVGLEPDHFAGEIPATDLRIKINLVLLKPFLYSASEDSVTGIGSTLTEIPLGSELTHLLRLRVNGAATDPVITLANSPNKGSATLKTITLSNDGAGFSLAGGEWVELDMTLGTILDDGGADQQAARDLGSNWPFFLDPSDGEPWNSDYPQLKVSSGTLDVYYRKAD